MLTLARYPMTDLEVTKHIARGTTPSVERANELLTQAGIQWTYSQDAARAGRH